jgi:hypothetical protein
MPVYSRCLSGGGGIGRAVPEQKISIGGGPNNLPAVAAISFHSQEDDRWRAASTSAPAHSGDRRAR